MIKTAIVAFGSSARTFHLPFIQTNQRFSLNAIVTSKPEQVAKLDGKINCYHSVNELLEFENVDLVVVTSPNDTHFDLGKKLLKAGCHVVMEKPMAVTLTESRELALLAEEQKRFLIPFHNRRFDGDFLTTKKLIANADIAEVKIFESRMDRFRPVPGSKWKEQAGTGTGLWHDLGPHLLDQALQLFGSADAVTAYIVSQRNESSAPDYFDVHLHYPDRLIKLGGTNLNAAPQRRFLIQGINATYVKYGADPQEVQLQDGVSPKDKHFGVVPASEHGMVYTGKSETTVITENGNYGDFYDGVAECLLNGTAPPVTSDDAVEVAKYLEMAIQSAKLGKTIIVRQYR